MPRASAAEVPPKLALYYSPKACSLAPHIALEESGLPYEAVAVDIRAGQNATPDYLEINPSGAVPALRAGDTVVTESHAILAYVGDLAPESGLIPRSGTLQRARAHEWMNFLSSTVHVAYRSIFKPQIYAGEDPRAAVAVRDQGGKKLGRILLEIERRLGEGPFALGSQFSVADAYLFVFYLWSFDERICVELPARPRYAALSARVWTRPAARAAVARERAVRSYPLPPELAATLPAGER